MLTQTQIEQFHHSGYVKREKLLDDEQVDLLRSELDRIAAGGPRPWGPGQFELPIISNISADKYHTLLQIVNIWEASAAFHDLFFHPVITEDVAQLTCASELRIWHDQVVWKPSETGGDVRWHQDAPLWPNLEPMSEISAWVALDDIDEQNGCMSMVPGSHQWGSNIEFLFKLPSFSELPTMFHDHKIEARTCPVRKGEIHYHHALTWHGSPANASGRPRRAIALIYMSGQTRYVASGEHVLKPLIDVADGELLTGAHFPIVWPQSAIDPESWESSRPAEVVVA